ncbi:hypothetical protein BCR42DRAFT_410467 [Absidia repens]|uniref:Uncharacterized protein n=1 Tax=Absidia repens TaxID=90262 RepID=A0A1X2IP05_9FUNG|nr:hypothetical protein BCR42DRAFT_410467 [Absidia repens]
MLPHVDFCKKMKENQKRKGEAAQGFLEGGNRKTYFLILWTTRIQSSEISRDRRWKGFRSRIRGVFFIYFLIIYFFPLFFSFSFFFLHHPTSMRLYWT